MHFLNENVWNLIIILLKFVSKGPHNNIPSFVEIMAWHKQGDIIWTNEGKITDKYMHYSASMC